jgi:hypothetical protein
MVGKSGGENGPHVHVEIRQAGANTSSGYLGVDARDYFGGGYSGGYGGGSSSYGSLQGSGYGSSGLFGDYSSLTDPNAAWRSYRR